MLKIMTPVWALCTTRIHNVSLLLRTKVIFLWHPSMWVYHMTLKSGCGFGDGKCGRTNTTWQLCFHFRLLTWWRRRLNMYLNGVTALCDNLFVLLKLGTLGEILASQENKWLMSNCREWHIFVDYYADQNCKLCVKCEKNATFVKSRLVRMLT